LESGKEIKMNYFILAFRNLKRKGLRSYLTLLGICIGIMAVVALITLGNGLKLAVTSQFGIESTELISVQAGGGNMGPPGYDVIIPLTIDDAEAIERIDTVEYAIPRNLETVAIEYNDKIVFTMAASIPEEYDKELYEIMDIETTSGRLLKEGDSKKVFSGAISEDGAKNGFEKDLIVGKKVLINGEEFEVIGILKKKGSFMIDGIAFMYDDDLKELVNYGNTVDIIAVKVKNKDLIEETQEKIEKLMRERRGVKVGEENFQVTTPEAMLETVNKMIGGIQIFIIIIASISIFIGVIGIVNTMTISVLERKKEIGIMKSIGAKNSQIFMQFFVESGFLGLVGGGFGVLLGVAIGGFGILGINSFVGGELKPQIDFYLIFFSLLGSFVIGALAGIFPAMKAAKQHPVDALRG
jgi:putative ABC transport system permease protein